jgi:hypothetical protein
MLAKTAEAVEMFGARATETQTPYCLAHGDTMFRVKKRDEEKNRRFGAVMKSMSAGNPTDGIIRAYDWSTCRTFVDVSRPDPIKESEPSGINY